MAAHRALRPAAGAHGGPARSDELLRRRTRSPTTRARSSSATRWSTTRCSAWRATAPAWPRSSIPKNGFRLKFGFQQSNTDATNLSDSLFTLSEVGYTFTPFALPEGTYRVWFRTDNTSPDDIRKGVGISLDQKLTQRRRPLRALRHAGLDDDGRDHFYSVGVGFQNGFIFNPQDTWGVGYAQMELAVRRA